MKYCNRPFEHVHLDPNGNVRVCSWTDVSIGNLLEEDIESIWCNEKAEEIRNSIRTGTYKYCRAVSCPYLENNSLEELCEKEFEEKVVASPLPISFNVACDFICNHSCPSCRDRVFVGDEEYHKGLDKILTNILPYINKAKNISACGNGDVFASSRMFQFLKQIHPENTDCIISLETNGALFDEKHWDQIKHLGNYFFQVAVTPNSFDEVTFKYLNGGHNTYENVIRNLGFIRELKKQGLVKKYEISMVMQDRNFWELPKFAERCINEFEADLVVVKPLYHWFGLSEEQYWFKDVLNPYHPYHNEYLEMMKAPVLEDSRVYFWGGKNLHKPQKHPAFRYKEYLEIANGLIEKPNVQNIIREYFHRRNIKELYLYGDMELSTLLFNFLKECIQIKGIIARDVCNEMICGKKVIRFCDYVPQGRDSILVLNYLYFDKIKRDFDFKGYNVNLLKLDCFVDEILNIQ